MKLYNTLTKKVEEFVPNDGNKVAMYTCGPTVYHFAHIGNLRSYIMEDVLETMRQESRIMMLSARRCSLIWRNNYGKK